MNVCRNGNKAAQQEWKTMQAIWGQIAEYDDDSTWLRTSCMQLVLTNAGSTFVEAFDTKLIYVYFMNAENSW